MQAKTTLTKDAQVARLIYLLRRTILVNAILSGTVLLTGLSCLVAYLAGGMVSEELKQLSIWILTLAAVVVLCVGLVWGMIFYSHKPDKDSYDDITSFGFGTKSFKYITTKKVSVGEGFTYTCDYVSLRGACETGNYFFLIVNSQNVLIADKAGFIVGRAEELRKILKKELGKKFKVKC